MGLKLRFLGTGTSVGVPQIGCTCPTCASTDPRDKRRRTGAYVTSAKAAFLIDTPPELRMTCCEWGLTRVDCILLTHAHMDHIAGFDDVRRFNTLNGGAPMRCYGAPATIEAMHHVFPYITDQPNELGLFRPMINFVPVTEPFQVADVRVTPFAVEHGPVTYGYLLESGGVRICYMSDCHGLPEASWAKVEGRADILVVDCLRDREHPTHFNTEGAVACAQRMGAAATYLVHMSHSVKHAEFEAKLPPGIRLAYDGLEIGK